MLIRNASEKDVHKAAQAAGLTVDMARDSRTTLNVRLHLGERNRNRYRRVGQHRTRTGKRPLINTVCYHGYFHFMRALFEEVPGAVVVVQNIVTYRGRADFFAKAWTVRERNIGFIIEPLVYVEACRCTPQDVDRVTVELKEA